MCTSLCQVSPTANPTPHPRQVSPTENNKIGMVVRARYDRHTITTPHLHRPYTIAPSLHHPYTMPTPSLHHCTITDQVVRGNSLPTPTPTPTPPPGQVVRGNSIVMMEALEKLWTEARPAAH